MSPALAVGDRRSAAVGNNPGSETRLSLALLFGLLGPSLLLLMAWLLLRKPAARRRHQEEPAPPDHPPAD